MRPSNDHEKIIAAAVDTKYLEVPDYPFHLLVRDIAMTLEFIMSVADTKFLVSYVRSRDSQAANASSAREHRETVAQ